MEPVYVVDSLLFEGHKDENAETCRRILNVLRSVHKDRNRKGRNIKLLSD